MVESEMVIACKGFLCLSVLISGVLVTVLSAC